MQKYLLVLTCLVCMGLAGRVHSPHLQWHSSCCPENEKLLKRISVAENLQSFSEVGADGKSNPLKVLARILLASSWAAAFNPSWPAAHVPRGSGRVTAAPQMQLSRRDLVFLVTCGAAMQSLPVSAETMDYSEMLELASKCLKTGECPVKRILFTDLKGEQADAIYRDGRSVKILNIPKEDPLSTMTPKYFMARLNDAKISFAFSWMEEMGLKQKKQKR
mmetsp:Transcript_98255/g.174113  ORF Transcript_98255/g.174113 Transcript_98255/m.174113 type:complete len:219 (+) Transcript_98255:55-711(+)